MKKFLFLILLVLVCGDLLSQKAPDTVINKDIVVFQQFPKESNLGFENFLKFEEGSTQKFYLTDSSLIVCLDQPGPSEYYFHIYSLKTKALTMRYVENGRGPEKILASHSSGLYKQNTLWLHDFYSNKLLTLTLQKKTTGGDSLTFYEYKLPYNYYSVQLMDSLRLLANGQLWANGLPRPENRSWYSSYKIQEFDLLFGKKITEYGNFSNLPQGIPFDAWKNANQAFLFLKPTEDKAVQAYRFADRIEIFDRASQKSKMVKGPENYEPEFSVMRNDEGDDIMYENDKTRQAFVNGKVTSRYIYLLYSGNIGKDYSQRGEGKYIYVYDWSGKPVAKFNLGRNIWGFTVSDDDTVMYAFDRETGYIMKTPIHI